MKVTRTIAGVMLFVLLFFSCSPERHAKNNHDLSKGTPVNAFATDVRKIEASKVCMVNDKYMNTDQIAIEVDGKIYYGCCQACINTIRDNQASHMAKDPQTNEQVDKATAFIVVEPGSKDEVLYFKSLENAQKYFSRHYNGG
ncbi:hypothetical protein BDE36_1250 [Arcticibacter tournemirensis]|uniref:TRASH domain-containing protein n=1 Tax=Arcticibacter tournemirensis TaxID=699437 RepID=A0A5M9GR65_9SPHI|nr:hypothetical protein [Arcticibacter tournemirensis]KAA8476255.1 hypothetical protein F1649_20195 [Arcticibacter tournemirensis]TQM49537.1 hypothetical protein BDE36_1250 [Arcticibacter tournemirensis]